MFYNARWYDPQLGRFAQADSIVPAGVQGYDRYAYVSNNPVKYVDPTGHIKGDPCHGAESGYKCNRDMAKAEAVTAAAKQELETSLNDLLKQIEDSTSCDGDLNHQTCQWEVTLTAKDYENVAGFMEAFRSTNKDPIPMDLIFGFLDLNPIIGRIENVVELFRGDYYDNIADAEDSVSQFFDDHPSQELFIRYNYIGEINTNKEGDISSEFRGELTAYSTYTEGPDNFYAQVDLRSNEALKMYDWFSSSFGK